MADRFDRIMRRSDKIGDRAYRAASKGKGKKADRLRRKSSKVAAKARDVACKINARGRKVCRKPKKRKNTGFLRSKNRW